MSDPLTPEDKLNLARELYDAVIAAAEQRGREEGDKENARLREAAERWIRFLGGYLPPGHEGHLAAALAAIAAAERRGLEEMAEENARLRGALEEAFDWLPLAQAEKVRATLAGKIKE